MSRKNTSKVPRLKEVSNKELDFLKREGAQIQESGKDDEAKIAAYSLLLEKANLYIPGRRIKEQFLSPIYDDRGGLYSEQGEYEKALSDYNQAIELNPKDAKVYNNRGVLYSEQGEYEKALADYNQVIELNPKGAKAYNNRGNVYSEQGEYEKALADYKQVIELNPKDAAAYNNRGNVYSEQGEYEKALADYNQAIKLNPKDTAAYNNRGNVYHEQGEYEKELENYNQAIELNPKDAAAYYNRGNVYREQGEYEKALADYNQAIKLNPEDLGRRAGFGKFQCLYLLKSYESAEEALYDVCRQFGRHSFLKGMEIPKSKKKFDKEVRQEDGSLNLLLILYFRDYFAPINAAFHFFLDRFLESPKPAHSQRIKTLESIVGKLKRFKTMKLLGMQDIAGNRLIFETLEGLRALEEKLVEEKPLGFFSSKSTRKDYIEEPKPDGYRSLHLIFEWKPEIAQSKIFSPFQVELQLRTQKQHYWATTVEVIDTFHDSCMKKGQDDTEWSPFFRETSQYITGLEKGNTPESLAELRGKYQPQFEELQSLQEAITTNELSEKIGGELSFYLISVIDKKVTVARYDQKEETNARKKYQELEKKYLEKTGHSVFLTSTDSFEKLKELYPNYFANTKNFLKLFGLPEIK